jgi:hypothetical protein
MPSNTPAACVRRPSCLAGLLLGIFLGLVFDPLARGVPRAAAQLLSANEVDELFHAAESDARVGIARKTNPVDTRAAIPGEVIVTVIKGEGVETRSKPAEPGDMVVRNRCPLTGNEEILVKRDKFSERYDGPLAPSGEDGWQTFRPRGIEMRYFVVEPVQGAFSFVAPWGETMVARPGDAIVRDPANSADTYRIAAAAFACTYEIVRRP